MQENVLGGYLELYLTSVRFIKELRLYNELVKKVKLKSGGFFGLYFFGFSYFKLENSGFEFNLMNSLMNL